MRRRSPPELNEQISVEAAAWLVEFRTGDITAEDRRAFERWVRSSPEHLRAYLEHAAVWSEGDALDAQRAIDVEALMDAAQAERNVIALAASSEEPAFGGRMPWRRKRVATLAASVLLGLSLIATLIYVRDDREPVYTTEAGEQRSIRLPDGSRIDLNSRSRVRVDFGDRTIRRIDLLEGQALFDVARDSARPFVVHSGNTRVRAVGTQFDVNRKATGMVVTVLEGKVEVSSAKPKIVNPDAPGAAREPSLDEAVYVSAGHQVAVNAYEVQRRPQADVAAATAWKQHQVVVNAAPLSEVTEEFNRYSERKLIAEDRATEKLLLSGVFTTDPEFLLRYLRARGDVTVIETPTEVRIVHDER
jgi:transmembrane sensor